MSQLVWVPFLLYGNNVNSGGDDEDVEIIIMIVIMTKDHFYLP